jgi:hypothetical protein
MLAAMTNVIALSPLRHLLALVEFLLAPFLAGHGRPPAAARDAFARLERETAAMLRDLLVAHGIARAAALSDAAILTMLYRPRRAPSRARRPVGRVGRPRNPPMVAPFSIEGARSHPARGGFRGRSTRPAGPTRPRLSAAARAPP